MVVAVWESYDAAHETASVEAATLIPLYRQTFDMSPAAGVQMRSKLREYTEDVVNDEWKSLETTGHASEKARTASGDILRIFGTLSPATKIRELIDAQFLATYSDVLIDRNKRLMQASESLSWIMWLGAVGGGMVVVGMSFIIYMDTWWPHALMASIMSGLIGLLLFMMAVLSRPFAGPLALESTPFESTMRITTLAEKLAGETDLGAVYASVEGVNENSYDECLHELKEKLKALGGTGIIDLKLVQSQFQWNQRTSLLGTAVKAA
jgi:hypothetical protein